MAKEINRNIGLTQSSLQQVLLEAWKRLPWEPTIDTPQGEIKGVSIQQSGSELIFVSSLGKIFKADANGIQEINLLTSLNLASQAKNALDETCEAQIQEINLAKFHQETRFRAPKPQQSV